MHNLRKNDPRTIWVSARESAVEEGSYENPYGSISKAVESAQPGQIVVLKAGTYTGDVTIQKSGSIDKPIRIIAEDGADVQCVGSCWFLYDVSDVICSGIVFKDSPGLALSVIGRCMRNRFEFLRFIDCSIGRENACTFYFGGSGQACNTVESCAFEGSAPPDGSQPSASIGLLIAEGDFQEGSPNRNYIISKNVFSRYGYGVIIGSRDSIEGEYGHRIENNSIDNCAFEGIMVKCGDTLVKGNVIRNCSRHSISIAAGTGSILEDNRILDCAWGIRVAGKGHSIANNCIIRCGEDAVDVMSAPSPEIAGATNIIIEQNTFVGWGEFRKKNGCCIRINPDATCVVRKNLFYGKGTPFCLDDSGKASPGQPGAPSPSGGKNFLITDNKSSGDCERADGCTPAEVAFKSIAFDNYTNDSGYGAHGWMLSPEAYDPGPETFYGATQAQPIVPDEEESDPDSEPVGGEIEATAQSLFFGDEDREFDEYEDLDLPGDGHPPSYGTDEQDEVEI